MRYHILLVSGLVCDYFSDDADGVSFYEDSLDEALNIARNFVGKGFSVTIEAVDA